MKLEKVGQSNSIILTLSIFLIKITAILLLTNNSFAYYAPTVSWYDYGYAPGELSMPPSGNGRISDWHARWPGHSDMYLTPSSCSIHGQGLRINCSTTSCGGGFTCRQKLSCSDGSVAEGNLCNGVSPKAVGKPNPLTCDGNPCDASTGNKYQNETDYSSRTLNFSRYYNSLNETESVLGKQWRHDYLYSLTITAETIQVNRHDGKVLEFHENSGSWLSDADITETLTQVDLFWEYKNSDDSIERYNNSGQLLSITTRDSKVTQFMHNASGLLEHVIDHYERALSFAYNTSNQLIQLTTPENTQIHYDYDVNNNLISVSYPDRTVDDITDNPTKIYHYENVDFPHHLTGITNENGIRYATYTYNEDGLIIVSEHADGVERVELSYNLDETTTVTNALGHIKTYTFETQYGLRKPRTIQNEYHDGVQVVTRIKTYTYYPENGQIKEVIDYNGHINYFEYNSRGLITLNTQAKGTPEEMTITTIWHPDYRLPAIRTYPDKIVTYSYDNKGQLINVQTTSTQ